MGKFIDNTKAALNRSVSRIRRYSSQVMDWVMKYRYVAETTSNGFKCCRRHMYKEKYINNKIS